MESVVRAAVFYLILMVLFRLTGKRALSEVTTFDLVLLLIISEATQEALTDNDRSFTNSVLLVATLLAMNVVMSLIKQRSPGVQRTLESLPLIILRDGKPIHDRMNAERVDEGDILAAARQQEGLERLDQLKLAILERNGQITVVPKPSGA